MRLLIPVIGCGLILAIGLSYVVTAYARLHHGFGVALCIDGVIGICLLGHDPTGLLSNPWSEYIYIQLVK